MAALLMPPERRTRGVKLPCSTSEHAPHKLDIYHPHASESCSWTRKLSTKALNAQTSKMMMAAISEAGSPDINPGINLNIVTDL